MSTILLLSPIVLFCQDGDMKGQPGPDETGESSSNSWWQYLIGGAFVLYLLNEAVGSHNKGDKEGK
ncbi:MAG: hypothetical protein NT084_02965 [Bacteroidetes bacterium]|nr:hypothetical protein [Bacteroidota bacterium]